MAADRPGPLLDEDGTARWGHEAGPLPDDENVAARWGHEAGPLPDDEQATAWWDHEAGPVVRPYMVTGGRVEPKIADLDLITHVVAVSTLAAQTPTPEHQTILALTQQPLPVAEVAARVDLPLGVVRVLLCDLLSAGMVARYDPPSTDDLPDIDTLQAVIHGLRAL